VAETRVRKRWRHRWGIARAPRDASADFDDAAYDGGVSGGAYTRHIVLAALVIAAITGLWAWAGGQA
jgi:hypothetical protein